MLILRSMLYMPAYKEKFFRKIHELDADAVIFDLEDSVPPQFKQQGRENLHNFLQNYEPDGKKLLVRLNSIESGFTAGGPEIHSVHENLRPHAN